MFSSLFVNRQQLDILIRGRHASSFQNTSMSEEQAVRTHGNMEMPLLTLGHTDNQLAQRREASHQAH